MRQTLYDIERGRRWGRGNKSFEICEHQKVTVRNYRETGECKACSSLKSNQSFFVPDTSPIFNLGLGCETRGIRHAERVARRQGKIPIGDTPFETVARREWPDHPLVEKM